MLRFLAQLTLSVLANAVGLLAASLIVSGFSINGVSFLAAVLIFSISSIVLGPLILKIAVSSAPYLIGGIALVTTFVSLFITTLFSNGITIDNFSSWAISTFVVWGFSVIGSLILPLIFFKNTLQNKTKSVK